MSLSLTRGFDVARVRHPSTAAAYLAAWLHFASGAVAWDDEIVLHGTPTSFLELMTSAESAFEAGNGSDDELRRLAEDLSEVRRPAS
ncbi:hypothetical protein ACLKM7_15550 [Microbacterium sp. I2]|uniref:hypothetical protein n=1 Tax=Microbacterium sp. I2 TaxID=3391826 RepID=UPI003ED89930